MEELYLVMALIGIGCIPVFQEGQSMLGICPCGCGRVGIATIEGNDDGAVYVSVASFHLG